MGDSSVEVTEENRDASQEAKSKGMEAISDGIVALFVLYTFPFGCPSNCEIDNLQLAVL